MRDNSFLVVVQTNFGESLCLNWIHIIQKFYFNIGKGGKVNKIGTISHLKCYPEVVFIYNLLGFPESLTTSCLAPHYNKGDLYLEFVSPIGVVAALCLNKKCRG